MHSAIYIVLPRSAASASTACLSPGPGPEGGGVPRAPAGAWAFARSAMEKTNIVMAINFKEEFMAHSFIDAWIGRQSNSAASRHPDANSSTFSQDDWRANHHLQKRIR